MTSLENQLKRLKTPQTEAFRQQKYRPSFIYDKKEAAAIDFDTHLRVASKGFKKLVKLCPNLEKFQFLFDKQSKDIERAVLQQDENDELSENIKRYMYSAFLPYFMFHDCHATLEFLLYKYQINTYQIDDFICAILPYHETRLFARALQTIDNLKDNPNWSWLAPYRKEGVPVPKSRVLKILTTKQKLPVLSLLGDKWIEISRLSENPNVYTSFFATTLMCILDRDMDERFNVALMPHIYKAIKQSHNSNLYLAGLLVVGYIVYTQDLEQSYTDKLEERMKKTLEKVSRREKDDDMRDLINLSYEKVSFIIQKYRKETS